MADQFQGNVDTLFQGMENFVTSKTCVGDPIRIQDTVILPLVDVSFGLLASTKNEKDRRNGGGGMGGKMSPSALLIIKDGATRLENVRSQDGLSKAARPGWSMCAARTACHGSSNLFRS